MGKNTILIKNLLRIWRKHWHALHTMQFIDSINGCGSSWIPLAFFLHANLFGSLLKYPFSNRTVYFSGIYFVAMKFKGTIAFYCTSIEISQYRKIIVLLDSIQWSIIWFELFIFDYFEVESLLASIFPEWKWMSSACSSKWNLNLTSIQFVSLLYHIKSREIKRNDESSFV